MTFAIQGVTVASPTNRFVERLLRTMEKDILWHDVQLEGTGWVAAVAGSGATAAQARVLSVLSGATGSSTAIRRLDTTLGPAWATGLNIGLINWTKRIIFVVRFSIMDNTTNGACRVLLGPANDDGIKDLDDKGIGFVVDNLALKCQTHNGTSVDEDNPSKTLVADQCYTVTIISDGAGSIETFQDGVSINTATGGPTGNSTALHSAINVQTENNADAASQRINVQQILLGVYQ